MSLILAALCAKGESRIFGVEHIERGLEDMLGSFRSIGADIKVVDGPGETSGESYENEAGGRSDTAYFTDIGMRSYMRKPSNFAVL
jgi:UDP-N-acetylglucosamine 1-carboxyvinyltransferase